jgi:hypothetical protein
MNDDHRRCVLVRIDLVWAGVIYLSVFCLGVLHLWRCISKRVGAFGMAYSQCYNYYIPDLASSSSNESIPSTESSLSIPRNPDTTENANPTQRYMLYPILSHPYPSVRQISNKPIP